ncbi:MAG: zinc metalloprotease HtpX [Bacteroidetes bacterium]|nr:zinc metalloprotease HtpX [Bacteroidota bacterium]MCH8942692.1 zinc metalloprotease HtpX [Bacteroidota bacterium]
MLNTLKTTFLMTMMIVLFLFVGNLLGGSSGMTIAFVFALLINFGSYWYSDKIVLKMYRAKEVTRENSPKFFNLVEQLSKNAGLPMPKVYIINDSTPNAFATGRNPEHAAVAATTGILNGLNNDELAGVIAHELAHIKNRDILIGTIAATVVGTITFLAQMAGWAMMFAGRGGGRDDRGGLSSLFLIILAPIAATLLQLAVSRSREFAADEGSALISGKPLALASALEKIFQANRIKPVSHSGPATAHMFIVNPLRGGGFRKLFSTHPAIEERIKRLRKMSNNHPSADGQKI